jgi:hypothetical protein
MPRPSSPVSDAASGGLTPAAVTDRLPRGYRIQRDWNVKAHYRLVTEGVMHLKRIKSATFITCTTMAAFMALATPAHAASSAATASPRLASATCTFAVADLGFFYFEPKSDLSLAWSSEGAASGNTVMLGNKKPSSALDCFKPQGFGDSYFEYQQYSSGLCLNVAGNSYSPGAYIILYPCVSTANERFYTLVNNYGIQLQSESSGLCVYLKSGLSVYSILEQEPCYGPGPTLQEFYAADS